MAWDDRFTSPGATRPVSATAIYDDGTGPALYVAGEFTGIAGQSVGFMARFDGEQWSNVGGGLDNTVTAMAVFDNELYVGGNFTTAGGIPVPGRWRAVCGSFR